MNYYWPVSQTSHYFDLQSNYLCDLHRVAQTNDPQQSHGSQRVRGH